MIKPARAHAPGKLFIAGEFAVVRPGEPAVLVAVDRLLTASLTPRAEPGVTAHSDAYPGPLHWRTGEAPLDYLTSALHAVETLRAERGLGAAGYDLHLASDLEIDGRKIGLGSSGAVTVAVIEAVAGAYGLALEPVDRFRLALCAAIAISPNGSGGDIAASTFGGWIRYTSPDRGRLADSIATRGIAATIADDEAWHGCTITPLPAPPAHLLVGWSGEPASTDAQVSRAKGAIPEAFYTDSRAATGAVARALETGDGEGLLAAITTARAVLGAFAHARGVVIETEELAVLADTAHACGGAGKSSGAGGGDCGIAFATTRAGAERILQQWAATGITVLPLAAYNHEGGMP